MVLDVEKQDVLRQPIIFCGVGRSGTTVISEIVLRHEELAWTSNYQNKFPNCVGINLVRPLTDNKLWRLTGQKRQLNRVPIYNKLTVKPIESYNLWKILTGPDIDFSRDFLLNAKASPEKKEQIRKYFFRMIKWQKRKRLAFKITGPSRIGYLTSIFPDALFVEITREPFSNIRSLLKVPFWEERGMHQLWWRGAYTEEEQRQAIQWRDRPALITALQYKKVRDMTIMEANRSNVKFLSIAFEDFVKRPYDTIDNILSFVELNKSKAVDKYMKRNKIFDRNSNAKQYFDQHDIEKMEEILGEYCN